MSIESILFGIALAEMFFAMILFVVFSQVTVRKLRKNPETKNELGIEFASGWDILNVAGALALPRWLNRKLRNTPLSAMYANAALLDKHTNVFDRILAVVFYMLWIGCFVTMLILIVLDNFGVFD